MPKSKEFHSSSGERGWQPAPYDPAWIVSVAKRELPNDYWLHEALSKCTEADKESAAYIYFVNPSAPNQPGSEWQFETNIHLNDKTEGQLVLDILKEARPGAGPRIGGVEFLSKLS